MRASNSRQRGIVMPLGRLTGAAAIALLMSGCKPDDPKQYRIGVLGITAFSKMADGFKTRMGELGYAEGVKVLYQTQFIDADPRVPEGEAVGKFVADGVDLIFAFPTEPATAAKSGTAGTDIPVIFGFAGLEGNDLVKSVRQPGGNVTGVRFTGPPSTAKRLEILLELAPRAKRIGVFYDPKYPNARPSLEQCRTTVASSGVRLVEIPTADVQALRAATAARTQMDDIGMDAILIMPDILSHTPDGFGAILKFANEHKLPIGGGQLYMAEMGAVFAYSPRDVEIGELCAVLADKVLRGVPAGTIPVVTPENHLWLNYKRAQELGLTVPSGMLSLAARIIR